MEFDDSEFDSNDVPDRLAEAGPPAATNHRALVRGATIRRAALMCAIAVAGIAAGRLSAESDRFARTTSTRVLPQQVTTTAAVQDCPANDVCRRYATGLPALVARLIALDFPHTEDAELSAFDDVSRRTRELVLTARLSGGLVLKDTASNRRPGRSTSTPWTLVAVRDSTHPDHAARTMDSRRGDATIHLYVAVVPGSAQNRPGRADFACTLCVQSARRAEWASSTSRTIDREYPGLVAAVCDGVQEVARSHDLAGFI